MFKSKKILNKVEEMSREIAIIKKILAEKCACNSCLEVEKLQKENAKLLEAKKTLMLHNSVLFDHNKAIVGDVEAQKQKICALESIVEKLGDICGDFDFTINVNDIDKW